MEQAMNPVHFASNYHGWETPMATFSPLNEEFHFECDVAALPHNTKVPAHYFTPDMDGLKQEWTGVCWCNPPYGREIGRWVQKAYESSLQGATIVCLLPCRSDTAWWHSWVMKADEVRFIRGRLKFSGSKNSAPFPSCVVIFRPPAS
jgi:phage N-6-adenine-methyltransferase